MKTPSPKHKVARDALSVVKRCILRLYVVQGRDVRALARASTEMRAILSKSDLPSEVKEDAGEVLDAVFNLTLDLALRRVFDAQELKTRVFKAVPRAFVICVNLGVCVAMLRSSFPYASCVPVAFIMYACGFKYPVKACASVVKALKKTR